jgi:integrase
MASQLTYAFISKEMRPGRYFDGRSGLHLLVKRNQSKYWIYRFQHQGKRQDMGLGVFPRVSLSDARKLVAEARIQVDKGNNPIKIRKEVNKKNEVVMGFQTFASEFINSKQAEWKNRKHAMQWRNTMEKYVYPFIGRKPINEIGIEDILEILKPIWTIKTETASRVRGRIERILAAASTRGLRSGVNPAIWRGQLDTILPQPKKLSRVVNHPALPVEDLPYFIERLHKRKCIAALALEFTILTAARTGEVLGARKDEVHGDTWIVPAERMKAGKMHRVPLSKRSLEIIKEATILSKNSEYIFAIGGNALSNMAMLNLMKRMGYAFTVHGFRSTFRDWVAEMTSYSGEAAEMALAHTIKNKAEAAYRRGDMLAIRKQLMEAWESYCINRTELDQRKVT